MKTKLAYLISEQWPAMGLFAVRALGAAAAFSILFIISTNYGTRTLGEYAIFVAASNIIAIVLSAGYSSIAPFFVATYMALDEEQNIKGFLKITLKTVSILSLAAGFVAITLTGHPEWIIFSADQTFYLWTWINSVGLCLLGIHCGVSSGLKSPILGLLPESLARPILTVIGLMTLIVIDSKNVPSMSILVVPASATWISLFLGVWTSRDKYARIWRRRSGYEIERWRRAAIPWISITLFWDFMIDILILTLAFVASAPEIALLHLCFRFRALVGFGMRSIYIVAMPAIKAAEVLEDRSTLHQKIGRANMLAMAYATLAVIGFFLFGDSLISAFGIRDPRAGILLAAIATVLVGRAVFGPAPAILTTQDLNYPMAKTLVTAAIFAIAATPVAYKLMNISGVVMVFSITNIAASFLLYRLLLGRTGIDCSILSIFRSHDQSDTKRAIKA